MVVSGKAKFLECRSFEGQNGKMNFGVFGFAEDFDRREVMVPTEKLALLPAENKDVVVTFQINKRYDGKEDIKLLDCKLA